MTEVHEERIARASSARSGEPDRSSDRRMRWIERFKGVGSLLFGIALFAVSLPTIVACGHFAIGYI